VRHSGEVDEVDARVTAAGFDGRKELWDAFWGQRYALLRDPDGIRVNLYATSLIDSAGGHGEGLSPELH
jgi:uncharacterized glyoxalase superfamily protein PhnB